MPRRVKLPKALESETPPTEPEPTPVTEPEPEPDSHTVSTMREEPLVDTAQEQPRVVTRSPLERLYMWVASQ